MTKAKPIRTAVAGLVPKRAVEPYRQLAEAIRFGTEPRCADDDRFIADSWTNAEIRKLAAICEPCPLLELCRAYSEQSAELAGFWGGHARRGHKRLLPVKVNPETSITEFRATERKETD